MEFTQEFAVVQGTLLTLQKRVGVLKLLTYEHPGDREKIIVVVDTILSTLDSIKKNNPVQSDFELRHVTLFLVFNSDLAACEHLMEDTYCGHLIDTAPTLSKDVMIALFCQPMLREYFHDLIVYCPAFLGVDLLDVAIKSMKKVQACDLSCIVTFAHAVYIKLLNLWGDKCDHNCEIDCVAFKFLIYYERLLEFLVDKNCLTLENVKRIRVEDFGQMLLSSLELVNLCLNSFVNPLQVNEDFLNIYNVNREFDYNQWQQKSNEHFMLDTVHEELMAILIVIINFITVDVWLDWADIDSKMHSNYSLQESMAESMYKCSEVIEEAKKKGLSSQLLDGLINMLSSMSKKPRDEDDEIREADLNLILKRILDKSCCQKKWFMALFRQNDFLFRDECVQCIKNNICLIDSEIMFIFLDNLFSNFKKEPEETTNLDNIRDVFLSAVGALCLEEQLSLLKYFLDKYGINSWLCCRSYTSNATKVFNTAIDCPKMPQEKKYKEFVKLSFQNPLDVMKRLLSHSVASTKQAQIMGDILFTFKPFHTVNVIKIAEESCNLLVDILSDIMKKRDDMEFSDSSFISIVVYLVNNFAIPVDDFLKYSLLPLVHNDLMGKNWSCINIWLETLQNFIDGTVRVPNTLHIPGLLLIIGQILELSRNNLCSFSTDAVTTCEYSINLTTILIESFLVNLEEGENLTKLCENLSNLVSPINKFYFIDLWCKKEIFSNLMADWKVYLLHSVHMEKCNVLPPWGPSSILQKPKLVYELAQLLPSCVPNEWCVIAKNLDRFVPPMYTLDSYAFECFVDAIGILISMSSSQVFTRDEQESSFLCLDFCIRNLSVLFKEKLAENPEYINVKTAGNMFKKIVHLHCYLPECVKESCSGILLNIQVDLISYAKCDIQTFSNDEDEEKHKEYNNIFHKMASSLTMLPDQIMRQVLTRKLQEGLSVLPELID